MIKTELFATPFWEMEFPEIDNELIATYIYEEYNRCGGIMRSHHSDTDEKKHTNWSSENIDVTKYPEIMKLMDSIYPNAMSAFKEFSPRQELSLGLGSVWFNVNKKGQSVAPHQHPGFVLAGVYYVKANENSACLKFMHPDKAVSWAYDPITFPKRTPYTNPLFSKTPKAGKFILFPGNLQHYVDSNEDDEDRVSIAFNFSIRY
jgi:uncharacterized protein (TIGR02466 family)